MGCGALGLGAGCTLECRIYQRCRGVWSRWRGAGSARRICGIL